MVTYSFHLYSRSSHHFKSGCTGLVLPYTENFVVCITSFYYVCLGLTVCWPSMAFVHYSLRQLLSGFWCREHGERKCSRCFPHEDKPCRNSTCPTKGTVNFRLPFVAHGRLCLSSLFSHLQQIWMYWACTPSYWERHGLCSFLLPRLSWFDCLLAFVHNPLRQLLSGFWSREHGERNCSTCFPHEDKICIWPNLNFIISVSDYHKCAVSSEVCHFIVIHLNNVLPNPTSNGILFRSPTSEIVLSVSTALRPPIVLIVSLPSPPFILITPAALSL